VLGLLAGLAVAGGLIYFFARRKTS
jgi:LPXTG-motif cell wall-anchored protein